MVDFIRKRSLLAAIASLLILASCESPAAPDSDAPAVVPLDGRGGGVIAYCFQSASNTEIYGVNVDGTGNKLLGTRPQGFNHPDWSPDARRLLCAGLVDASTVSIFSVNADGSGSQRLTDTAGIMDKEPDWSPDGARIAFVRDYAPVAPDRREIWVMDADGAHARVTGAGRPGDTVEWSRDGSRFLYSSDASGRWEVYTCGTDGSDIRRLTSLNSVSQMHPSWSADGSRIVFVNHQDGSHNLMVMNADGSQARSLMNTARGLWMPKESPDGTLIAFGYSPADAPEHWEIYVSNPDGTGARRVTNTPGTSTSVDPDWRPRPDASAAD